MNALLCNSNAQRERWAVSLCFSSAILSGLEALHSGSCAWMGMDNEQSYAISATLATVSMFLGAFILTKRSAKD
jgi:hypothetical protein